MRKSILLLLVFGLNTLVAQTVMNPSQPATVNPPPSVITKFGTEYPNITPTWGSDGSNYTATYTDINTSRSRMILYDRNGNILNTSAEIDAPSYPPSIVNYYTKTYPNESYKIWSSTDNNGNVTYYSNHNSDVIWFDKDGKYKSTKPGNTTKTKKGTKSTGSETQK